MGRGINGASSATMAVGTRSRSTAAHSGARLAPVTTGWLTSSRDNARRASVNITADDDGTLHAFVVENSPGNRSRTPLYMGEDLNAALVATNEAITQFTHLGFRDYESGDAVEARRFDFQQSAKELHISDRQGVGALNKPRRPSAPAWRD